MTAVILTPHGPATLADLPAGETEAFAWIRAQVDGYVEQHTITQPVTGERITIWMNEDGRMRGLPVNPLATSLWLDAYPAADPLVGTIVVTGAMTSDTIPRLDNAQELVDRLNAT